MSTATEVSTTALDPNEPGAIADRYARLRLPWWPVLLFLPARTVLSYVSEAITAGVFWLGGSSAPWRESTGWWMVYGTLTDLGCLALLVWLTRRERLRIRELLGLSRAGLLRQLRSGFWYVLAFVPVIAVSSLVARLFYGDQMVPQVSAIHTPAWASFYSIAIWPIIWGFTEELVYLGYLLPRLQAWTGKTLLSGVIVVAMWGLQHSVIPFIADQRYQAGRVLGALIVVGGMTAIFMLGRRRLISAMTVHYVADFGAAISALALPRR
jgi:membrane protease YdiL (CAAX protease family)